MLTVKNLLFGPTLLCLLAPAAALAQTPLPASARLSLSDSLSLAQSRSLSVAGAQARLDAAAARLRGSGAPLNPTLSIAHAFGSQSTGGFDEDLILSQTIELGKRGPRSRAARAEFQAATFDAAGSGTDFQFALKSAYFEALRAQSDRDLAAGALQSAQTFDAAAKTSLQAGDVPRANVVRSQIEVARASQSLDAAQTERDNRFAVLQSLLGQTPLEMETPLELADSLSFSPVAFDSVAFDLVSLQNLAIEKRADLQKERALLASRTASVSVARAQNRPDAFVEARRAAIANYAGAPNGNSLRVGVVVPLVDLGSRKASVSQAQADLREETANLEQTTRSAQLEVQTALATLQSAARAVQSFQNGRLDRSRELLDMAQTGYEHGANSYLELLDAQNVFRAEASDYTRALADWNVALASLERAVGGQLP